MSSRLPVLQRRTFLLGSFATLGCAACGGTGPADASGDGGASHGEAGADAGRDAHVQPDPDSGVDADSPDSGAQRSDAGPNVVVVGPASAFPQGTGTFFRQFMLFIVHDAGGLFAMTSVCTHAGCDVEFQPNRTFKCPCHGSTFDGNGKATAGPAVAPLDHFALSTDVNGDLVVEFDRTVPPATRLPG